MTGGEVRAAYDQVAQEYEVLLRDELDDLPVERAQLRLFGELVQAEGGQVLEVGYGPGRIAGPSC